MKPNVAAASNTSDELLERAANRLAIRRFGCCLDALRDRDLARALFAEADTYRRRWYEQRARAYQARDASLSPCSDSSRASSSSWGHDGQARKSVRLHASA